MSVDIEKLRELEQAATDGPWAVVNDDGDTHMRGGKDGHESLMCDMQYYPWPPSRLEDWHFIAALRNAAPDMLTELEQLRAGLAALVAVLPENYRQTIPALDAALRLLGRVKP